MIAADPNVALRVAAAVLNQTPLDWEGNERRVREALQAARAGGASLVCLPEMCLTGYGCEDTFLSLDVVERAEAALVRLLPATEGLVVSFGLPVLVGRGLYNAAALVADGRLVGLAAKRHLANDGIHYEARWFKPWPVDTHTRVHLAGRDVPIGDLVFEVGGVRVGFEICEDAWVAVRPGAALASRGVDLLLNPSASHFAFGKIEVRRRFVLEGSRAFGTAYVYANLVGNEAGRAIYDGGALIAANGRMLAEGPRFGLEQVRLCFADVDIAETRMALVRSASHRPNPEGPGERLVEVAFTWPDVGPLPVRTPPPPTPTLAKDEEFTRAQCLALWDYLRKSRAAGFVVSLSGGCDSAAVVALVNLMLRRAVSELGLDAVVDELPCLVGCRSEEEALRRLLTTVYQGTSNSSAVTRDAARSIATAVGARHVEWDVEPIVAAYLDLGEVALGRRLDWGRDDIAMQNIQARVRAPGAWLVANVEGKLLLATSNRTEAAVGYATMDGDTAGGLSPLAGIDKAYLRRWLVWLQSTGPDGLGPMPALEAVTRQRSTPELRPAAEAQTSEEDLMPFEVLDLIERLAIRDKLAPAQIYGRLAATWPERRPAVLFAWISRFFVLFARNQWKRERYAPSFHLDDENLDPKTWCRFPILSGGFARELAELRAHIGGLE